MTTKKRSTAIISFFFLIVFCSNESLAQQARKIYPDTTYKRVGYIDHYKVRKTHLAISKQADKQRESLNAEAVMFKDSLNHIDTKYAKVSSKSGRDLSTYSKAVASEKDELTKRHNARCANTINAASAERAAIESKIRGAIQKISLKFGITSLVSISDKSNLKSGLGIDITDQVIDELN